VYREAAASVQALSSRSRHRLSRIR
jgi:hypothetical protein